MTDVAAEPVVADVRDGIATLTLDNASRRNTLSVATMQEITAALREVGGSQEVGAVVVRAEGPRSRPVTTWVRCSTARWRTSGTSSRCARR
ncbi:hypothetical protein ACFQ0O_24265 [Saccharopolyspora spinosporotrichia]